MEVYVHSKFMYLCVYMYSTLYMCTRIICFGRFASHGTAHGALPSSVNWALTSSCTVAAPRDSPSAAAAAAFLPGFSVCFSSSARSMYCCIYRNAHVTPAQKLRHEAVRAWPRRRRAATRRDCRQATAVGKCRDALKLIGAEQRATRNEA